MKTDTRKYCAVTKMERLKTGGGPTKLPVENKLLEKVKALIGATVDGLESPYDCDADYFTCSQLSVAENTSVSVSPNGESLIESSSEKNSTSTPRGVSDFSTGNNNFHLIFDDYLSVNVPEVPVTNESESQNWAQWTPAKLRTPKSAALELPMERGCKLSSVSESLVDAATSEGISKKSDSWVRRRRPFLPKLEDSNKLLAAKLELVELTKKLANEEAAMKAALFKEQMKQEKIKTRILLTQLRKAKKDL